MASCRDAAGGSGNPSQDARGRTGCRAPPRPTVLSLPRAGVMSGTMREPAMSSANSPLVILVLRQKSLGRTKARIFPAERFFQKEVPAAPALTSPELSAVLPPRLLAGERKHTILQLSADFRLVDLAGDRIEGERTSCGIREVAHRRQILPQQILRNLDGFDNYAIRNHAKTMRTRLFWLGELSDVLFVPGMGRMAK